MREFGTPEVDPFVEVVTGIEMPIQNAEFAIHAFLMANGNRLDLETRTLLAGVRDCLHKVTDQTRRVTRRRQIPV